MRQRWHEFFEAEGNGLSMGRLLAFLSFFPSSYIAIKTESETIFGWYISAYSVMYIGGKTIDLGNKLPALKGKKNDKPSPDLDKK